MATKTIKPSTIRAVNASYDDMSDYITDTTSLVGDSSQELLASGTKGLKAVSKNITDVVESLNTYLNSVADAFEESDLALSNSIENNTVAAFDGGTDSQNAKSTEAYGKVDLNLPG